MGEGLKAFILVVLADVALVDVDPGNFLSYFSSVRMQ